MRAAKDALLALLEGALFLLRDSRARSLLLLPGLVSTVSAVAFLALAASGFDRLGRPLLGPFLAAADSAGLGLAAWTLLAGAYFSASAVVSLAAAALLAGPLLDRIAACAERPPALSGEPAPEPGASVRGDFLRASRGQASAFALAPIGLLPLLGPLALLCALAWTCGRSALAGSLRRLRLSPAEREAFLRRHRAGVLAYGLATFAVSSLPVLGAILALPAAHAGAPRLIERLGAARSRRATFL